MKFFKNSMNIKNLLFSSYLSTPSPLSIDSKNCTSFSLSDVFSRRPGHNIDQPPATKAFSLMICFCPAFLLCQAGKEVQKVEND